MDTSKLKKFAQYARRTLLDQVSGKLDVVLAPQSAARRERAQVVAELEKLISNTGRDNVTERVAYTWFNRFCALRFMDVNRYTRIGVVSPAEGQFQPEILAEAKMGHIDEEMVPSQIRQKILDLLAGRTPSTDSQGEAYRLLVVAACNAWHQSMPFLFERIDQLGFAEGDGLAEAIDEQVTKPHGAVLSVAKVLGSNKQRNRLGHYWAGWFDCASRGKRPIVPQPSVGSQCFRGLE